MVIVGILGAIAGLALLLLWVFARARYLAPRDIVNAAEQFSGGLTLLAVFANPRDSWRALFRWPLALLGVAAAMPALSAAGQRRRINQRLDQLEAMQARIGERVASEKNMWMLTALGELTAELPRLRVAVDCTDSKALPGLEEKVTLWITRVEQSEEALFGVSQLICEVQTLFECALQSTPDESVLGALQELSAKMEGYIKVEVSFLKPELTQALILELVQARQLLRACVGDDNEETP